MTIGNSKFVGGGWDEWCMLHTKYDLHFPACREHPAVPLHHQGAVLNSLSTDKL